VGQKLADRVSDMAIHYTNLIKKWNSGQIILFVYKSELSDAFIGHRLIKDILKKEEL
jgi:hypothetical protein